VSMAGAYHSEASLNKRLIYLYFPMKLSMTSLEVILVSVAGAYPSGVSYKGPTKYNIGYFLLPSVTKKKSFVILTPNQLKESALWPML
jgi:hypothetical protein